MKKVVLFSNDAGELHVISLRKKASFCIMSVVVDAV